MNTDGEYLESKHLKIHRRASVIFVVICGSIYGARFGFGQTLRAFAGCVLPLSLIWFSDQLAGWAVLESGGWLNSRNADSAVRVAGWLILLILLGLRAAVYFSYEA